MTRENILAIAPRVELRGPIQHGDLIRENLEINDRILIIDGVFHHASAIRHKEILWALSRGVHVVGTSSMGALRAAELQGSAMVGSGRVFEEYRDGVRICDDHVVVLHQQESPFRPLTVPLVTFETCARMAHAAGRLDSKTRSSLIRAIGDLHYSHRSWEGLPGIVSSSLVAAARKLQTYHADHHPHVCDIKRTDALEALREVSSVGQRRLSSPIVPDGWIIRTTLSHEWYAHFQVAAGCSHATVDQIRSCVQLYSPGFPAWWADTAVNIAGGEDALNSLTDSLSNGDQLSSTHVRRLFVSAVQRRGFFMFTEPELARRLGSTWVDACEVGDAAIELDQLARIELGTSDSTQVSRDAAGDQLRRDWSIQAVDPMDEVDWDVLAHERCFLNFADAVEASLDFFLYRSLQSGG